VKIIILARCPAYDELTLLDTAFDPVEAHVHGLGALGFECVVEETYGAFVV
jgi:hypothetical protein